jgi:hypothetical protein
VEPVAVPAVRRLDISQSRDLRVERVPICCEPRPVAIPACCGGLCLPGSLLGPRYLMRRVAIATDRRTGITSAQGLTVHPRKVIGLQSRVAGAAGGWNIGLVGAASRILAAEDFVGSMATRACRRDKQPVSAQSESMDRINVERVHIRQSISFRQLGIPVAGTARAGNIQRIHR